MVHFCVVLCCTDVYNTFGFLTYLHVLHFHPLYRPQLQAIQATVFPFAGSLPFVQLMIGTLCRKTLLMLPQSPSLSSSWIYIGTMHVYTDFNY